MGGNDATSAPPLLLTATGATVTPNYLPRREDIVGVTVSELRELGAAARDEVKQLLFAELLIAGAVPLAVERAFTEPNWESDPLLVFCIAAIAAGLVVGYFGCKQSKRRTDRIEKIIADAEKLEKQNRAITVSNTHSG